MLNEVNVVRMVRYFGCNVWRLFCMQDREVFFRFVVRRRVCDGMVGTKGAVVGVGVCGTGLS